MFLPDLVSNYTVVNGEYIVYGDISTDGEMPNVSKGIDWQAQVKGLLKGELKRQNVSYADLAERLGKLGIRETPENIANKISRGGFTAVFLVQCLTAIGLKEMRL